MKKIELEALDRKINDIHDLIKDYVPSINQVEYMQIENVLNGAYIKVVNILAKR